MTVENLVDLGCRSPGVIARIRRKHCPHEYGVSCIHVTVASRGDGILSVLCALVSCLINLVSCGGSIACVTACRSETARWFSMRTRLFGLLTRCLRGSVIVPSTHSSYVLAPRVTVTAFANFPGPPSVIVYPTSCRSHIKDRWREKYFSKKKGKRYIKKGIHTVLVVIHNKMNHLGFTFTLGMSRDKTWTTRTANHLQENSTAY